MPLRCVALLSTPGACYLPDVQAPTASPLHLVFPPVCFCFSPGRPFCGGFAPSGRIWCRISRPLDRFFVFPADLSLGFELRPSLVSFYFVSFSGVCLPLFGVFLASIFVSPRELPPPPTARCGSFTRPHHVMLPSPPSSAGFRPACVWASPRLFMFLFCFHVLDLYLFSCFYVSTAQPISSAPVSPLSVHCRAFPCNPTTTSPQHPLHWLASAYTRLAFSLYYWFFLVVFCCFFPVFFFSCNKSCLDWLALCVMLGSDLWVMDVNIILAFGLRRTSVGLRFLAFNVKE
jgi:hypothetical protein